MTKKRVAAGAALSASILLLGGCEMLNQEEEWTPRESGAISVGEDGKITEYISETLDQAYYSSSELQNMITSEVNDYNSKNGENSVVVKNFEAEGSQVKLEMEYAKAADYAAFNNVEFYYGSMINAQLEGYLFDVSYKKVKNGVVQGSAVSGTEVLKNMADEVLVVQAPLEVHVPGNVLFTSTNAEVLSSSTVNATGESEKTEDEGLVLPSSAVYQDQKESSFDEERAAKRVYIVFETE